jgi:hypothetical protein
MSSQNGLRYIVIRGFLIVVLLLPVAGLSQEKDSANQHEPNRTRYAVQQAPPKLTPVPFDGKEKPKPNWANPECDKPKDHDEADLCVQRDMAKTAKDVLFSSYVQIALSVVGAILLFWTLYYTRRATRAAIIAANAAKESADALPAIERAYIFAELMPNAASLISSPIERVISKRELGFGDAGSAHVRIMYRTVNHGKTPAIIKSITSTIYHLENLPKHIRHANTEVPTADVVRAGDTYPMRENGWFIHDQGINIDAAISIKAGRSFVWICGRVLYDDVFGRERETRFCWRYNRSEGSFEQYDRGDEELNRRT